MGVLTPQAVSATALTPQYSSVSASDTVDISALNDRAWLHVKNTHSSSETTTVVDAGLSPAGNSGVDPTYTVAATTGDRIIRLRSSAASAGVITITHSNTNALVVQGVFYLAD
jgi:hypothetical protein